MHRVRIAAVALLGLCFAVAAAGCGAGSPTTTVDPDSGLPAELTAPFPGPGVQVELQARAMARAWREWGSGQTPVCVRATASAELRAAIARVFLVEVEYLDAAWPELAAGRGYRCVLVTGPGAVVRLGPDLVGVEAGAAVAELNAGAGIYQFRWDGSEWQDATPQETGVTPTTRVS
ncbi:MAG: hypothetical protein FJW79_09135 [Actinobacteria bacterium]|nr:hypothetical protein [Actinomycetota bacterium]